MAELICPRCRRSHYELVVPGLVLPDPSDLCPDCRDLAPHHPVSAYEALLEPSRRLMTRGPAPDESGSPAVREHSEEQDVDIMLGYVGLVRIIVDGFWERCRSASDSDTAMYYSYLAQEHERSHGIVAERWERTTGEHLPVAYQLPEDDW